MTGTVPLVEMRDISIQFGGIKAVDGVTVDLYPGEVVGLLGHNGAGKSTLIKILSGAYQANSGQILINGQPVEIRSPRDAKALGIETIEVHHEDNPWIINGLAVAPRRVIITEGASGYTLDRLASRGVEVITVRYDLVCSGGGGPHCSTAPLIRDPV